MKSVLKKLIREYVQLVSEALRSDEGIHEWLEFATAGDTLEGSGDDRSTGWTCKISITCVQGYPTEDEWKAEFEESLKLNPLGLRDNYDDAFQDWKSDVWRDYEPSFNLEYVSVVPVVDPVNEIAYQDLRAKNKEAAYEFGQYWSPHETLKIYHLEQYGDEDALYVVKPFNVWKWGDFGWEKINEDADDLKASIWKEAKNQSPQEVEDILDEYTDKAFY